MNSMRVAVAPIYFLLALLNGFDNHSGSANDDLTDSDLRNRAVQNAIKKVEESVVRLDLFSSRNSSPAVGTGVLVGNQGLLVTSSYFIREDTRVVANVGDNKIAAKIVGKDQSRNLCLLQLSQIVKAKGFALKDIDHKVGQTVIAIGRSIPSTSPSVSVGIVSAKNRMWGKAIQTDAKISPVNYGGPLVNLKGEIVGLLTPISLLPSGGAESNEWYDSGIGFAIPAKDVIASVNRMQKEGSVYQGLIGIRFSTNNTFRGPLVVSLSFPRSPAQLAGIETNDIITRVNQQNVNNLNQFKMATGRYYAGDSIEIEVTRNKQKKTLQIELVKELAIYRFPYLGLMCDNADNQNGVKISKVDRHGPMAKKVSAGDIIQSLNGSSVQNTDQLREALSVLEAGQRIELQVVRNGVQEQVPLTLGNLATDLKPDSFDTKIPIVRQEVEKKPFQLTGFGNQCYLLAAKKRLTNPKDLLLVLANSSKEKSAELAKLESIAEVNGFAVLVVYPESINGWQAEEVEPIRLALRKSLSIAANGNKVTVIGRETAGSIACQLSQLDKSNINGIVFMRPPADREWAIPLSDPGNPFHSLVIPSRSTIQNSLLLSRELKENGIPVSVMPAAADSEKFVETLINWIWLADRF